MFSVIHHIHAAIPNSAPNLPPLPLPLPLPSVPAPSAPSVPGPTLALPLPLPLPLPLALAVALHMNGEKWFSKQVDQISIVSNNNNFLIEILYYETL